MCTHFTCRRSTLVTNLVFHRRGEDKNEAALQRKHEEKAELDKLNLGYAKQMQRYSTD